MNPPPPIAMITSGLNSFTRVTCTAGTKLCISAVLNETHVPKLHMMASHGREAVVQHLVQCPELLGVK
jgi:hypothetical protein